MIGIWGKRGRVDRHLCFNINDKGPWLVLFKNQYIYWGILDKKLATHA